MIARPIIILLAVSTTLTAMAKYSAPPPPRAQGPDGKALYEDNCRKCHGVRGVPPKAIKEKFPKVQTFTEDFLAKVNDDSLVKVMVKGVGKAEDMKSFKDKLNADEMAAVAKYVREIGAKNKG
jgi:mono/diheme cytochrome c family protein